LQQFASGNRQKLLPEGKGTRKNEDIAWAINGKRREGGEGWRGLNFPVSEGRSKQKHRVVKAKSMLTAEDARTAKGTLSPVGKQRAEEKGAGSIRRHATLAVAAENLHAKNRFYGPLGWKGWERNRSLRGAGEGR